MSLIVFPFKDEELDVVAANLATAARHERVTEVWAVAAEEDAAMAGISAAAKDIGRAGPVPLSVFAQKRLGDFRSGKGDGMNTAIAMAAERGFERVHFYDADITNFDETWIDGAEAAADRGYGVVRHRFPRAATDAMITWMVTRPGLALLYPRTLLTRFGQPLGGELLLTRPALEALAADPFVVARSDWGIDTIITHATASLDIGIWENNVANGKRHALYGSLTDIRDMILECLDAVSSLSGRPEPRADLEADPPAPVPADLKETVGYDVAATRAAIAVPPDDAEQEVLASLHIDPAGPFDMDGARWQQLFPLLLKNFELSDPAWRSAVFRLWVERVIHYTTHQVPEGYDAAMAYLDSTIKAFEDTA